MRAASPFGRVSVETTARVCWSTATSFEEDSTWDWARMECCVATVFAKIVLLPEDAMNLGKRMTLKLVCGSSSPEIRMLMSGLVFLHAIQLCGRASGRVWRRRVYAARVERSSNR